MVVFLTIVIVSSLTKIVYHHILWWMLLFISPFGCGANHTWAIFKTLATFHYTNWLIEILLLAYHNPQITGVNNPPILKNTKKGEMITAHQWQGFWPPHHHTVPQPKGCCTSPQRCWPGAWNSWKMSLPSREPTKTHPTWGLVGDMSVPWRVKTGPSNTFKAS